MGVEATTPAGRATVVLGLGNLLRRDEGLGIRALERLRAGYALPSAVRFVDGGTLGLELLCYLEEADRLLVLDAVLDDGPPGAVVRLAGEEVPAFFGLRTSPHEVGLADLLAVCRLRGSEPREVVVLGLRPETVELGWDLSDAVAARIDALAAAAADQLRRWGLAAREPARASAARSERNVSGAGRGRRPAGVLEEVRRA
jgi:hydrogenase maturation protease